MSFFRLIQKIRSFFVETPNRKLTWCRNDYELGKKWSKGQPHPFIKNKSLWDYCYDPYDSVYTLNNLKNFIK